LYGEREERSGVTDCASRRELTMYFGELKLTP
jgi:hypothetical protein